MIRLLPALAVLAVFSLLDAQEPQKEGRGSLTLEDVIQSSKTGTSDELLIARIKRNGKPFDLNADEIAELKRSGVSEGVIKYLLDPTLPYTPAAAPPPPPATPVVPKRPRDPLAEKVPPEAGIYYLNSKRELVALDVRSVMLSKQPGKIPGMLSGGLRKGHVIGTIVGPGSQVRLTPAEAVFCLRLGEKMTIDDLALLKLETPDHRRDLDFGTQPGKPVFPVKSVMPYESKEIGTGLYRLSVSINHPGEYLFFFLGTGDDKKGLLGKGYDFGVN
jgi:hypothetical protein